jgi:hypothetical protein
MSYQFYRFNTNIFQYFAENQTLGTPCHR